MTRAGTKRAAQPSIEPKYSAISKPFRVKDRKDALSGIQLFQKQALAKFLV